MFRGLLHKARNSKALASYFLLTYADKVISFLLPLVILFWLKDQALYTFIEVAFSYATLVMIGLDLGVSTYLFYGYRNATDKTEFLKTAGIAFHQMLLIYAVLLVGAVCAGKFVSTDHAVLILLIGVRSLFSMYVGFFSNIFRLEDRPSRIYALTIAVNLISLFLLVLASILDLPHKILYFFLPSAAHLIYVCVRRSYVLIGRNNFILLLQFLMNALRFAWPVILNVFAMSFINNYAKIYSYNRMSLDDTTQISYIMRMGLLIQLTHASFSSFFAKSLFMDEKKRLNLRIFGRYNLVLWFSAFLVCAVIFLSNRLLSHFVIIPVNAATFLFILYIVIWCYIGFLELYFGVMNANRRVLYYSIFASLLYVLMLKLFTDITIFKLALAMVLSALLNLGLVIMGLFQLKVINIKRSSPANQ
jgi:hypothetical protein